MQAVGPNAAGRSSMYTRGVAIYAGQRGLSSDRLLNDELPAIENFRETASGILAVSISKLYSSYIFWFRPEVIQTVQWAVIPGSRSRLRKPAVCASIHGNRSR